MNLKESINKTELLKNNIETAKDKINLKLISFGGNSANTLADVPNKIEELRTNFNYYAEGDLNVASKISSSFGFTLPVDFDVKYLILTLTTNEKKYISKFLFDFNSAVESTQSIAVLPKIQYSKMTLNKKGSTFMGSSWSFGATTQAFKIVHWVALG